MSWLWPEYISRDLPLTAGQRKVIRRNAWKLWAASKWNLLLYLILPAFYLAIVPFAADLGGGIAQLLGVGGWTHKLFRAAGPFVLCVVCFVLGGVLLQRYRFAPCVYRATRRQGHDVCTECGYWLRGLGDEVKRCPECGAQREPMPEKLPPEADRQG